MLANTDHDGKPKERAKDHNDTYIFCCDKTMEIQNEVKSYRH